MNFVETKTLRHAVSQMPAHSAWKKGVQAYADLLMEDHDYLPTDPHTLQDFLLNGAQDWHEYSYGGCALIYDGQIAETLCNKSELIRTRYGDRNPNKNETWLDVQTRALYQAYHMIATVAQRYQ